VLTIVATRTKIIFHEVLLREIFLMELHSKQAIEKKSSAMPIRFIEKNSPGIEFSNIVKSLARLAVE
jgi:hypothetical protein